MAPTNPTGWRCNLERIRVSRASRCRSQLSVISVLHFQNNRPHGAAGVLEAAVDQERERDRAAAITHRGATLVEWFRYFGSPGGEARPSVLQRHGVWDV